jgi:hypothetical protein
MPVFRKGFYDTLKEIIPLLQKSVKRSHPEGLNMGVF